jgi:hypothetical protein
MLYVYAIVAGSDYTPAVTGIDGSALHIVGRDAGPRAVVHRHTRGPFDGPDDSVRRWVLEHSEVIDDAWQNSPALLPVSFNVIVRSDPETEATATEAARTVARRLRGDAVETTRGAARHLRAARRTVPGRRPARGGRRRGRRNENGDGEPSCRSAPTAREAAGEDGEGDRRSSSRQDLPRDQGQDRSPLPRHRGTPLHEPREWTDTGDDGLMPGEKHRCHGAWAPSSPRCRNSSRLCPSASSARGRRIPSPRSPSARSGTRTALHQTHRRRTRRGREHESRSHRSHRQRRHSGPRRARAHARHHLGAGDLQTAARHRGRTVFRMRMEIDRHRRREQRRPRPTAISQKR